MINALHSQNLQNSRQFPKMINMIHHSFCALVDACGFAVLIKTLNTVNAITCRASKIRNALNMIRALPSQKKCKPPAISKMINMIRAFFATSKFPLPPPHLEARRVSKGIRPATSKALNMINAIRSPNQQNSRAFSKMINMIHSPTHRS